MIDIDDDINLDDIWLIFGWNWWYLVDIWGEIDDLYVCSYMRAVMYRGVYCASYILVIFGWNWDEIDDIINEIDDNYTSLIVWW